MGQKVNPQIFRLGIGCKTWKSVWYADKGYKQKLHQDLHIRSYINKFFKHAGIADVTIERKADSICVTIYSLRPGAIIGKKGSDIEKIKQTIAKEVKDVKEISVNAVEVKRYETNAALVAYNITQQLEKRASFRRVIKRAIQSSIKMGVEGIKISCSGRLGGAEIARTESYKEGRLPLHTMRADIDYAFCEAKTICGILGVKVLICMGS